LPTTLPTHHSHRIAVVPQPAGAHGGVELEDRRAEVLRRRPELQHVHPLGPQRLRHLRRLPGVEADAHHAMAPAQLQEPLSIRRAPPAETRLRTYQGAAGFHCG
jgi:hypothetical protein